MRIPRPLAWLLLAMSFFTAGLLRQFHDEIPRSPFFPPAIGSLLVFCILFLLLVAARETRQGAVPGPGIRLGSLTPLLLMLLVEKWMSMVLYIPVFHVISSVRVSDDILDARFRAFAGAGLLVICLLLARFSEPARRRTWRASRPARWPMGLASAAAAVVGTYIMLMGIVTVSRGSLPLRWPEPSLLTVWILGGQALRAFAEEVYYRGLLQSELARLAPRLGARGSMARRWLALLPTSIVFGMEHLTVGLPWHETARQMIFTVSLGLLLGILVMVTSNLVFAAGVHAWINWLLLGVAPRLVDSAGAAALPPGSYVAVALVLAFIITFLLERRERAA